MESSAGVRIAATVAGALPLTVCFAGGGVDAPWIAAAGIAVGLLLLLLPTRGRPPAGLLWAAGAFVLASAACALPSGWAAVPEWRVALEERYGVGLGSRIAVQPQVSLDAAVPFAVGLAWVLWLMGLGWNRASRMRAIGVLAYSGGALAVVALLEGTGENRFPFWHGETFGPFPNRNHTASVFAMCGVAAAGLAAQRIHDRRQGLSILPIVATVACAAALAVGKSRAGLLLFGAGTLAVVALVAFRGGRKAMAWSAAGVVLAAAGALWMGGATFERLGGKDAGSAGFRLAVWQDTLRMALNGPWAGVGPGSFEGVFPQYRQASVVEGSVIHPENDWLYLLAECGWFALAAAAAGAVVTVSGWFRITGRRTAARVRFGAAAAASVFLAHSFVDVPGHRLGSWMVAATCLAAAGCAGVDSGRWRWVQRAAGIVLIAWCARWGAGRAAAGADEQWEGADAPDVRERAIARLTREPLAWRFWYLRGAAEAAMGKVGSAWLQFRRAAFLEPNLVDLPLSEAGVWLGVRPSMAVPAWAEAFRRAKPEERLLIYGWIVQGASRDAGMMARVKPWAGDDPELLLAYHRHASAEEVRAFSEQTITEVGAWPKDLQRRFARLIARRKAADGDPRSAFEMFAAHAPKVPQPPPDSRGEAEARLSWMRDPSQVGSAFRVASIVAAEGHFEEALSICDRVAAKGPMPAYFSRAEAWWAAETGDWARAWKALERSAPE